MYCSNSALVAEFVLVGVVEVAVGGIVGGVVVGRGFDMMWGLAGTCVVVAAYSVAGAGRSWVPFGLAVKVLGSKKVA